MINETTASDVPSNFYVNVQLETEHFHESYWDLDFDVKTINAVDRSRLENLAQQRYLDELIKFISIQKDDVILDVGCGTGATAIWLVKKYGCSVYGIDIVEENIAIAKERIKNEQLEDRIQVQQLDALKMDFTAQKFNHVIGIEAIYHIEGKKVLFSKINEILKPEGYVVFSDYMLEKPYSWFLDTAASEVVESKHIIGVSDYQEILTNTGFVKVDETNVSEHTIIKMVEYEKSHNFRDVKYTSPNTIFSCVMINIFAPIVANSLYKGAKNQKFKLNFMTYKKN